MIQANLSMCRETRILLTELENLAKQSNITTLVTCQQVYNAEQLILKYYTSPVLNTIKSKLKSIKSKSSKHFTVEYWATVIDNLFICNNSVKRENSRIDKLDDIGLMQFMKISQYLVTDYSIIDANIIYDITHSYTEHMVVESIKKSMANNVYNIQYVKAIIEKEQALSNIKLQEMQKLGNKIDESMSAVGHKIKVNNSIVDVATISYNWQEAQENAEIEEELAKRGLL